MLPSSYVDFRPGLPLNQDKRKWGNNKARMWGKRDDGEGEEEKRKWGEKSSRLWGKRMDVKDLAQLLQDDSMALRQRAAELQSKRKWAKNKARMWG